MWQLLDCEGRPPAAVKPNGKSHLAGVFQRLASLVPCFVMHQGTERQRDVAHFVMDAVAGARRTRGRHKTGGAPPKPPATISLSLSPAVFWDFGSLYLKALRRPFGRLLRQRQSCDVAASRCVCRRGADKLIHKSRLWKARLWVSSRKLAFMVSAWTCGLFFNRDFRSVSVSLSRRALSWRRLTLVFSAARFLAVSLVSGEAAHYAGRYDAHWRQHCGETRFSQRLTHIRTRTTSFTPASGVSSFPSVRRQIASFHSQEFSTCHVACASPGTDFACKVSAVTAEVMRSTYLAGTTVFAQDHYCNDSLSLPARIVLPS